MGPVTVDANRLKNLEAARELLRIADNDAGVQVFIALEDCLVALRGRSTLQMDMASVALHAGVEILIQKFEGEAHPVPVEIERPRQILHPEDRGDMAEQLRRIIHDARQNSLTFALRNRRRTKRRG